MNNLVTSVRLVDAELLDLDHFEDLDLPVSSSLEFPLLDHDAGECRITDTVELRERYIDNHIVRIMPPQLNMSPLIIDVEEIERNDCEVHYDHNRILHLALDRIDPDVGAAPRHFMQTNGLIFPVDEQGNIVLNASTVPFLAAVRRQFQADMELRSDQLIEMAQLVNAFASIISLNSNVGEAF